VAAGGDNPLLDRIAADPAFGLSREEIEAAIEPRAFTGRSAEQVDELLAERVEPLLARAETAEVEAPRV
jgi:adenylosuccinate lyase